ncbi:HAMP domain-containing histidine kinase [Candidatus Micrarchaeota archaeon]|nr:HAMP domain-containing histidine kinase [Candidatus Micrarchaeota archaeon]
MKIVGVGENMFKLSKQKLSVRPGYSTRPPKRLSSGPVPKTRPSLTKILHYTGLLESIAEDAGGAFSITFGGKEVCSSKSFHAMATKAKKIPIIFDECEAELNIALPSQNSELVSKAFLGEVCLGLCHDFRNVLGSIILNIDHILSRNKLNGSQEAFRHIRHSVELGIAICNNLQHAGTMKKEPSRVSISEVIDSALSILASYLKQHGVAVEWNNVSTEVNVVSSDLQLAIMNVVMNAVQHGVREKRTIKITCCDTEKFLYLAITNEGEPIPDSIRDSLLKEPLSSDCINGLGLYSSARNLKEFGASMSFDSDGQSTSFLFQLPK